MRVRRLLHSDFERAFQSVDLLLCPTSPSTAFRLGAREKSQKQAEITIEATKHRDVPSWLSADQKEYSGKVNELPKRDEASIDLQEQLIVEFCSK